jgi:glycogen operon protein
MSHQILPGSAFPLGAEADANGVNFALFAAHADAVMLCLFDESGQQEISRHALPGHTDGVWHGYLPGARAGLVYAYRIHGAYAPGQGHHPNPNKLLLDPYARAVVGDFCDDPRHRAFCLDAAHEPDPADNVAVALKAQVVDEAFDWAGDQHPHTPWADTVIYEAHVKGFTRLHPQIPAELRGSYAGLAHPAAIGHLRKLGVSAIELLPVQYFVDEPRLLKGGLSNYWGYNPVAWFAPARRYASGNPRSTPLGEFREMVRALHAAGIEVILDVVFNHTAELDVKGPTLFLRGIDNASYYNLRPNAEYEDSTGCGNALNFGHPRVVQLVMDCLRYWVSECHVDGFRFDLAVTLGRVRGSFDPSAALLAAIIQDPVLARTKFIAEPWDIGWGGYQVGRFPAGWGEWNDKFRDTMRRFWLCEGVNRGMFAHCFAASSNTFKTTSRRPSASINFVTVHDGFNLADLVSYNQKHNLANQEDNRDGNNDNNGWNCGVEGETDAPHVLLLRRRVAQALLATLLLAQGTPMLLAGDELGHSQQGNNNAYCQDNEITWLDWSKADAELGDYVARVLAIRKRIPALAANRWWSTLPDANGVIDVDWFNPSGARLENHDWEDPSAKALMVQLSGDWLILVNGSSNQINFRLPVGEWRLELCSTEDVNAGFSGGGCIVAARSVTVLAKKSAEAAEPAVSPV